jgi:hypothetical protein
MLTAAVAAGTPAASAAGILEAARKRLNLTPSPSESPHCRMFRMTGPWYAVTQQWQLQCLVNRWSWSQHAFQTPPLTMQVQQQRPGQWQRRRRRPGQQRQWQQRGPNPSGGGCITACASGRLGGHTGESAERDANNETAQPL